MALNDWLCILFTVILIIPVFLCWRMNGRRIRRHNNFYDAGRVLLLNLDVDKKK
jgi:hypothetical protein